jgi:hypothetical protein
MPPRLRIDGLLFERLRFAADFGRWGKREEPTFVR